MITVFGSINVDLVCHVPEVPGPGQTVIGSDYVLYPGGKGANQALAARRAGAKVRLVGCIGNDPIGSIALVELRAAEIDLVGVARLRGTTGLALIYADPDGELAMVVSPGMNMAAKASAIPPDALQPGDTLLLQLEVPIAETLAAARSARQAGARVILSLGPFYPLSLDELAVASIIKVSRGQAAALASHLGVAGGSAAGTRQGDRRAHRPNRHRHARGERRRRRGGGGPHRGARARRQGDRRGGRRRHASPGCSPPASTRAPT